MEKGLAYYQKMTKVVARVIVVLAAAIVGLDVLSIFAEAVGRYIIGESRAFMEEFPRLLVPFIVFPMMGVLLQLKKHITVDVLPERLKGKARSLLLIIVYAVVLAVGVQFLIAGVAAVDYYKKIGFETLTEFVFPTWVTYLPFPIGFGLLILFTVELLWRELVALLKLAREEAS